MNYFAHGMRFIDRPYLLAGTAVPDWLRVADPKCRVRPRHCEPFTDSSDPIEAELAAGILQHLEDDRWFHRSAAFYEVSGELTRRFRDCLSPSDDHRTAFLGHITTELLLDGVLIEEYPEVLDGYYRAMQRLDPDAIQTCINRMAARPTSRLAGLIPLFLREQFLRDYCSPERLLYRLNQVLRRIKLNLLPESATAVLVAGRSIVEAESGRLLPTSHFPTTRRTNTPL